MTKRLVADPPVPMPYLYRGQNFEASNVVVPTIRLLRILKQRRKKNMAHKVIPLTPSANAYTQMDRIC